MKAFGIVVAYRSYFEYEDVLVRVRTGDYNRY